MTEFVQFVELKRTGEVVVIAEFKNEKVAEGFMKGMQDMHPKDMYYLRHVFHCLLQLDNNAQAN